MIDPYLTAREILVTLKVHMETVYRLTPMDNLQATQVGRSWRFQAGEIRAWFRGRRRVMTLSAAANVNGEVAKGNH